jgi:hypothetical protein
MRGQCGGLSDRGLSSTPSLPIYPISHAFLSQFHVGVRAARSKKKKLVGGGERLPRNSVPLCVIHILTAKEVGWLDAEERKEGQGNWS